MATVTRHTSAQALDIAAIDFEAGDIVIVDLTARRLAKADWENGGVSWTINSATAFNVKVEHSLMPRGNDDAKYWTEDSDSPYTSNAEGNEHFRVQRIRFTAMSGSPTVVVSSDGKFTVRL